MQNTVYHINNQQLSHEPKTCSFSKQQNWQWYDDEGSETPIVPLDSENVSPSNVGGLNVVVLRVSVAETADVGATDLKFRLQFATSSVPNVTC